MLWLGLPAAARADTGRYFSLMPVGQGSNATAADFAAQALTGEAPPVFTSQRDLFAALLPIGEQMPDGELTRYFKPAPLDPPANAVTEAPRPGVTIARDEYGVPYVTGTTRADVNWGAGYAQAQDRLFFMDVLRHTAQGRLTNLIGPGEGEVNAKADAAQLAVADYTNAELLGMVDAAAAGSPGGAALEQDLAAYTAGVNAYIAAVRGDPQREPAEYALLGKPLADWTAADSVSLLGLLNGYFGLGGGGDLNAAAVLAAARARFGRRGGGRVYRDFRSRDDPEAPVVVTRRFAFDDPGRPRRAAIAMPDPGSVSADEHLQGEGSPSGPAAPTIFSAGLGLRRHASNALLIDARHAVGGHPLLVAGPQVGFYSPPILHEMVLRGPGIAVRGPTVPGAGFPIAGRGSDFAWSVTTAQGDNTDVFAERLCEPDGSAPTKRSGHYVRRGRCVPFTVQERPLDWEPGPADALTGGRTTPYHATIRVARSVHGPVFAHGTVGGRPVAFARDRASYGHEVAAALGLTALAVSPITGPRDFQRRIAQVSGSYNWFYADAEHIAYVQSGIYPRRGRGTHPELPTWGTGRFDWRGKLPFRRLPQAVDPARGYLVSWNQKQAPGWRASDADWQYGSVHRSQRLESRVRRALRSGKVGLGQLAAIMGNAGTVDVRGEQVLPWLLRALGPRPPADVAPAVDVLRGWVASGAHRRDADLDGAYDDSAAVALMDAWWGPLVDAIYRPILGDELFDAIAHINYVDYLPKDGPDTYYYGWYGYVQKDLRALLGKRVRGRLSRGYCGGGAMRRCRETLRRTLTAAAAKVGDLKAVRVAPTCPETVPQTCDQLQFIAAGAITVPPMPWQDRGSFQQAVQVTG